MPAETEANAALDLIAQDAFKPGPNWSAAHEIVQGHEGEPVFDAIHALLHRIEGDAANGAYWDRRAGTDFGKYGPEDELAALRAFAAQQA
ncbi:MAG: hypothetical protein AAGK71_03155 [Pseudomonadota bacterium]